MPPVERFPELRDFKTEVRPFSEDLVKGITILLMTATPLELQGVMGYLEPKDGNEKIIEAYIDTKKIIKLYIGKYGNCPVAVGTREPLKARQDETSACNVTTRIMEAVKPRYVIVVGICYSLGNSKVSTGDVIVSDTLQANQKIYSAGATLLSVFSSPIGYSHTQYDKEVKVCCGPIFSHGELVNPDYEKQWEELRPDVLGSEQEGTGIMAAIENATSEYKVEAIAIKAIGNWDVYVENKSDAWKPFSSHAAARYVHHQMEKYSGTYGLLK